MLHEMPKRHSAALVAHPEDALAEIIEPRAERSLATSAGRVRLG